MAARRFFWCFRAESVEQKSAAEARSGCLSKCFVAALGPDAIQLRCRGGLGAISVVIYRQPRPGESWLSDRGPGKRL